MVVFPLTLRSTLLKNPTLLLEAAVSYPWATTTRTLSFHKKQQQQKFMLWRWRTIHKMTQCCCWRFGCLTGRKKCLYFLLINIWIWSVQGRLVVVVKQRIEYLSTFYKQVLIQAYSRNSNVILLQKPFVTALVLFFVTFSLLLFFLLFFC